jgi:sporulation protein YlmC with PRC-barrel domain
MTSLQSHELASGLLDLPLIDSDGKYCGIVDDVELDGDVGGTLRIHALLVGPGAYSDRLPRWAMAVVRMMAGNHLARIPWNDVHHVTSAVHLRCRARDHRLGRVEDKIRAWIPRRGAL